MSNKKHLSPLVEAIIKARIDALNDELSDEYGITLSAAMVATDPLRTSEPIRGKYSPRTDINRVEVFDDTGRAYVKYKVDTVQASMQDGGKTMKVFITTKENQND